MSKSLGALVWSMLGPAPGPHAPPEGPLRRLSVASEEMLLSRVETVEELLAPNTRGARTGIVPHVELPGSHGEETDRVAGEAAPAWASHSGVVRSEVGLFRARNIHHTPAFGAVIDAEGHVFRSTVSEALFSTPKLTSLPHTITEANETFYGPPPNGLRLSSATVFVGWGGRHNYGHFLLDCLPGLVTVADLDLLGRYPAIAPSLTTWQRELLGLTVGEKVVVEELSTPSVSLDDVLWTTCMDHFLHAPNAPLDKVRARILANSEVRQQNVRRIYLSRRGDRKRTLVNEASLETALTARGFRVVDPSTLTVVEQVGLFQGADIVVAATGAALANSLFLRSGAKVFEIQPENYMGVWVRALCRLIGVDWQGYFCRSPLKEKVYNFEGTARAGMKFSWRLPIDDFLSFLDARI